MKVILRREKFSDQLAVIGGKGIKKGYFTGVSEIAFLIVYFKKLFFLGV